MKQNLAVELTESGYVPDSLVRHGIRKLLRQRLEEICAADVEKTAEQQNAFVEQMNSAGIALLPDIANEQQVEVAGKLDWVGMNEIEMPVRIEDDAGGLIQSSALVTAYVNLKDPDVKGIHMSRLYLHLDQGFGERSLSAGFHWTAGWTRPNHLRTASWCNLAWLCFMNSLSCIALRAFTSKRANLRFFFPPAG